MSEPTLIEAAPPGVGIIKGDIAAILRMGAAATPKWARGSDTAHVEWKGFKNKGREPARTALAVATGLTERASPVTISSVTSKSGNDCSALTPVTCSHSVAAAINCSLATSATETGR